MKITDKEAGAFLASLSTKEYVPLQLDDVVFGWVESKPKMVSPFVRVVMGNRVFEIMWDKLTRAARDYEIEPNAFQAYGYTGGTMVLKMPAKSLDIEGDAISLTEHSTTALCTALSNCFQLNTAFQRSSLNKQTPAQVVKTLLWMYNNGYPMSTVKSLSWRGKGLQELVPSSSMECLVIKTNWQTDSNRKMVRTLKSFIGFVRTQTALTNELDSQQVFFLQATSDEEMILGDRLFQTEYLQTFLKERGHKLDRAHGAAFFFAREGDILADWVVGETITVPELYEAVVKPLVPIF